MDLRREADPLWRERVLDLVRTNGSAEPSGRIGYSAEARGEALVPTAEAVRVELSRVLTAPAPEPAADAVGVLVGTWHPDGPEAPAFSGHLAIVLRQRR
ncbi:hypothetical protein [Allokutzneria albata]|uniref:hypothetical protein n=1 Tax=Allokutzneria albata TaxID=211114 RepID=UPI0012DCFF03|nr:hypothetical protein [Allokutzneria albata]